jgi:predicted metalloprotease
MRLEDEPRSENIEDRRGMKPAGIAIGGIGTLLIVLVAAFLGADPRQVLNLLQQNPIQNQNQQAGPAAPRGKPANPAEDKAGDFVAAVLGDTELVWSALFQKANLRYRKPTLVLFEDATQSGCGFASSAVGPFYCPADQKVYIDLAFYHDLKNRFHAPGEFAEAYVIAHEIGHHVQNLLGISEKVHALQQRGGKTDANRLSVRLELQADFLAGVWAHHAERMRHIIEEGDIEGGLRAASAIGDDRLQREARGYVVPDSFTHGSSEQRMRWFSNGYKTGDMSGITRGGAGDTFNAEEL